MAVARRDDGHRFPAHANPLRLVPDPSAARDARAWVTGVLSSWPEDSVEVARLLISELVTNAVLHARTSVTVAHRRDRARARFEVTDGQPVGPTPKRYAIDSPTGRGMRLVASLADDWGVRRDAGGKTVWFVVSPASRAVAPLDLVSVAAGVAGDLREIAALVAPRSTSPPEAAPTASAAPSRAGQRSRATARVDVVALGLPVEVYLEAEQHNDAIVRELTLIVQSAESESGLEVPRRLLELASDLQAVLLQVSGGLRAQVEDAVAAGRATVDVHISVPREGWETLPRVAEWLDEVDRYCVDGNLLTLASTPRLRRFRTWYARQFADQMRGLPPTPWDPSTPA